MPALSKTNLKAKVAPIQLPQDRKYGAGGASPRIGLSDDLTELLKMPAVGLRGTMYATRTLELPFALSPTAERIQIEFGQEINYFSMEISTSRSTQAINNLISTATVRTPFLCRAIAFVLFGEFEQGAIAGYKEQVDADAAENSVNVPFRSGLGPALGNAAQSRPATFRHGWDVAEFFWAFSRAYRLQMFLGGDLRYVDELLGHIGTIEKGLCWQGYGQAQRSIADYIYLCNQQMGALGSNDRFLPITGEVSGETERGILPPVIYTQIGAPVMEGAYAASFPVRPFVALPGVPIDIQLVRENNDTIYYDAMASALAHGGTVRYAPEYTEQLNNSAGNAQVGYACDVQFKYGRIQIGTILLGARITSRCCLDWYYNMGAGLQGVYEGNPVTVRTMERFARDMGLDKIPTPRDATVGRQILSGLPDFEPKKNAAGVAAPPSDSELREHFARLGVEPMDHAKFRNRNQRADNPNRGLYETISEEGKLFL